MDSAVPRQKSTSLAIFLLLLVIVVGLAFAVWSLSAVGTATTTTTKSTDGYCPGVDLQQEAFLLAQQAELTRKASPYAGNYADAWFGVCFTNGTTLFGGIRPMRGFNNEGNPATNFTTHSEQAVYVFLQRKLAGLKLDAEQVVAIDVVIFSQVQVCSPCQTSMISWQESLRQAAGTQNLFLSVWDLGNNGFDPAKYKAGTGTPVTLDDVHQVDIPFE